MLKIYQKDAEDNYVEVTEHGTYTGAVVTVHNGRVMHSEEKQLWVRNDAATNYYSGVTVTPVLKVGSGSATEVIGLTQSDGWIAKLISSTSQPTETQWDFVAPLGVGWNTINLGSIGSSTGADLSYHSFWFLLQSPANIASAIRKNISLRLEYISHNVLFGYY